MSNAGLFGSDVDYGEECENIDKNATSRQSEQNASWARYMEMPSTSWIPWWRPNDTTRIDIFEKNSTHHTWQSSPQPSIVNSLIIIHRQYMVFSNQNKNSENKRIINKIPDHDMSPRWRDDITSNPTKDIWIEAHIPMNVEQVPVKKRIEIGRPGHHVRDDSCTWHRWSSEKKVSVRQYNIQIMTIHKIVLLYQVKTRQVIGKY